MKLRKKNNTVLNAKDKFGQTPDTISSHADLAQLGEIAIKLLNEKDLEVSKVRPFFWSLVETYVDRFQHYPFDVNKALFSYLELNDYPAEMIQQLVEQLESQYEKSHGHPFRKSAPLVCQQGSLDDEIRVLRDSLKYAAMVAEKDAKS